MAHKRKSDVTCHSRGKDLEGLVLLPNIGDCIFPYVPLPRDTKKLSSLNKGNSEVDFDFSVRRLELRIRVKVATP